MKDLLNIEEAAVPISQFTKTDDFDYQTAISNKIFNMKKKDEEFIKKFPDQIKLAAYIGEHL